RERQRPPDPGGCASDQHDLVGQDQRRVLRPQVACQPVDSACRRAAQRQELSQLHRLPSPTLATLRAIRIWFTPALKGVNVVRVTSCASAGSPNIANFTAFGSTGRYGTSHSPSPKCRSTRKPLSSTHARQRSGGWTLMCVGSLPIASVRGSLKRR